MGRLQIWATNFLSSWATLPKKLKRAHRYRLEEQKYADARIAALLKERGLGGYLETGKVTDDGRKPKGETKREREKRLKEERNKKEVGPATRAKNGPCTDWAKRGVCARSVCAPPPPLRRQGGGSRRKRRRALRPTTQRPTRARCT